MLNRWIGITCVFLMVSANTALFVRDVLPGWLAGDPPQLDELRRGLRRERCSQVGIFDAGNHLVGRSWTVSRLQGQSLQVDSSTMLYPILLPNGMATPRVRIDTDLRYREEDGALDELVMIIRGLPAVVELRGAHLPPDEFGCEWRLGTQRRGKFILDAAATRALGDVLRPFSRLPGLYVGRSWRLHLLDPLTQIVPGLQTKGMLAEPETVRVTGVEAIEHRGRAVEAFVVETRRMRAWVAQDGSILRQRVELPLVGKLVLRDEPFDRAAYEESRAWATKP